MSINPIKKYAALSLQAKASFWFFVCTILQRGISVLTTPIFTRLLTPNEYGSFSVFVSWEWIFSSVCILTLPYGVFEQGLVKYYDRKEDFTSSVLGLMTALDIGWICVYFAFKPMVNNFLGLPTLQVLLMFSLIWTTAVFNFWAIRQRVDNQYKALVIVTIVVSIAKPLAGILLVLTSDDKVTARIVGLAVVEFVGYLWMFISIMKKGKLFFDWSTWKYALAFNLPLVPHYLSQRVLSNADRIMIKNMVGSFESGIYSLAYQLSMLMTMINTALQSAVNPWVYKRIKAGESKQIPKVAYPTILAVAMLNFLLIMFAPEIVRIFAPPKYMQAIWIIPPVAMSVFFMFVYGYFANIELYYEQTKQMALATLGGAVLNIILNYAFIQRFGYIAAGYTTLVCYFLYAVFHYCIMRWICKTKMGNAKVFSVSLLGRISIVFVVGGFALMLTYQNSIIRYIVVLACILLGFVFRNRIIAYVKKTAGMLKT